MRPVQPQFLYLCGSKKVDPFLTGIQMADQFDIYLFRMGIDQEVQFVLTWDSVARLM